MSYRDTDGERAARILAALSTLYVRKHTSLHRPSGEIQFFEQQTEESEKRLKQSEAQLVHFTNTRGVASAALERDIALQKLGEADAAYRQMDQDLAEIERRTYALREQLASFPSRSVTVKRWADNPEPLEKQKSPASLSIAVTAPIWSACLLLVRNPDLRRESASRAQKRIRSEYSWPAVVRAIEKSYYEILGWEPSEAAVPSAGCATQPDSVPLPQL